MARLIKHYNKPMSVKLTIEERIKVGEDLTTTLGKIKDEEARSAEVRTDLKTRMTRLESERDQLSRTFMRGEEIRDVLIRVEADDTRELVYEIREDTGEVLTTRIPYVEERQVELPLADTVIQIPGEGAVLTNSDGTVIISAVVEGEGPIAIGRPGGPLRTQGRTRMTVGEDGTEILGGEER